MSRFAFTLVGLGGLVLAGCSANDDNAPTADRVPAITASSRTGADDLPLPVSAAFHRDYPTAGITRVVRGSTETGQPIYRITYIAAGSPGSETYFVDGSRLPRPDGGPAAGPTVGTGAGGTTSTGAGR
jgi:hypothetical protein